MIFGSNTNRKNKKAIANKQHLAPNIRRFAPSILCVIICSILLLSFEFMPAFADVSITIVTPTGGALSATSDCTDITAGNGIIWHGCNNVLYAVSMTTNAVLANISATLTSSDTFLSTSTGTSVLVVDASASTVSKYTYSSGAITLTGIYTPSTCTFPSNQIVQYDYIGFIWLACDAQDTIVRLNPVTMTEHIHSQDLTDGAGVECDQPIEVVYDANDDIGGISCNTTNNIVTFTVVSTTSITLLDSEAGGGSELFIDGGNNRLVKTISTTITELDYSSTTGVMTQDAVLTINTDSCYSEPILSTTEFGQRIVCLDQSGTNTVITAILSNDTSFEVFLSTVSAFSDPERVGLDLGTTDNFGTFYIASNTNNQKYIKIEGLRDTDDTPIPPITGGGGGGSTTGINCDLPENANILTCRLGGDGSLVGAGNFVVGDGSEGTGLSGVFCALGVADCTVNDDIKTNGIGYLIFLGGILVMFGLFWMVTKGNVLAIPTFIWIIAILSLAGAFALFNIIDPVVFIITIVAVIALAVPKIISTVRGDTNTLGAGTTS
jgi:hypothetical protein